MLTRMEAERISFDAVARRRAGQGLRRSRSDRRPRRLRRARQAVRAGAHRPARRPAPGRRALPIDPAAQGRRLRLRASPRLHDPPGVAGRAQRRRQRRPVGGRGRRAGAGQERLRAVARARLREPRAHRRRARLARPASSAAAPAAIRRRSRSSPTCCRSPGTRRLPAGSARWPTIGRPPSNRCAPRRTTCASSCATSRASSRRSPTPWRAHDLNIDAVLQEGGWPKDALPFVVTLEPARREVVDRAIDEIVPLDFHVERPVCLPIVD